MKSTDFPDYNDGNSTDLIGTFRSALLTGEWTIVLEYEELSDSGDTYLLSIHTNLSGGEYQDIFQVQRYVAGSSKHGLIFDKSDNNIGTQREINTSGTSPVISNLGIGTHKIAITRTAAKLAASINGSVLLSPTGGYSGSQTGFAADKVAVGGFSADFAFGECYLRKLLLYSEQADSELPTLSA